MLLFPLIFLDKAVQSFTFLDQNGVQKEQFDLGLQCLSFQQY